MPILWRRSSIISRWEDFSRSRPSKVISPAVGSISRDMQRTRVDLPEPDRPMMTKISPDAISSVTSRTAPISPAPARSAAVGA